MAMSAMLHEDFPESKVSLAFDANGNQSRHQPTPTEVGAVVSFTSNNNTTDKYGSLLTISASL